MKEPLFTITKNLLNKKRIGEWVRIRGLVEGLIYVFLFYKIIDFIPFVKKVKRIIVICIGIVILVECLVGYKNQTPSEIIINIIKEKPYKYHYRLRSIADEEGNDQSTQGTEANKSYAEKVYEKAKSIYEKRKKER